MIPFGKYFLLERINVGGMAEVYKAKTVGVEGFEKVVAIKRILPSVAEDEDFIRMFVDEAKITSQLSHASLAQTFDLGKIDGAYYIAMEYVPGKDLRAVFERKKRRGERMPWQLSAFVVSRVCEGLDYAHRKRDASGRELHIVHRDVSPQNILLSFEGEVKLIDFGIAKAASKITRTQSGILKGKFGYMSPEQVRGLPLDGRSDIFAAGVVLYELCTGERLFTGASDFAVLEKVQQARVTPPSRLEPSLPPELERILLKALAREPRDRYPHAEQMAAELNRFLLESRAVTRDDLAAFMKATFPEDERREAETPLRRPPPRIEGPPRRPAPRLEAKAPWSAARVPGEDDPDKTVTGPSPPGERAEIIVRSKLPPSALRRMEQGEATVTPVERPAAPEPRLQDQETQLRPRPPPAAHPSPAAGSAHRVRRWKRGGAVAFSVLSLAAAWALRRGQRGEAPEGGAAAAGTKLPAAASAEPPPAAPGPANSGAAEPRAAGQAGELVVLSSPPGAQVYLDGERKGQTPAFFPLPDPAVQHAVSVEKRCYRAWQVALPPRAGPRQLAATLQPAPGACPGIHPDRAGMPAPAGLPDDAPATLGFLNLGSRPAARVLIDGVDIGQVTPLVGWPLQNGPHRLRLSGADGSKELSIEIRAGETRSATVDLSPAAPARKPARRRARR